MRREGGPRVTVVRLLLNLVPRGRRQISASAEMAANPGHSGSQEDSPISDGAARQIASGFKLPLPEVLLDALQVSGWAGQNDDLLVWLEHRHAWTARGALAYLLSLRTALQHNSSQGSSG